MKFLVLLIAIVVALSSALLEENHVELFSNFKKRYNKHYKTPEEEAERLNIFRENLKRADELNSIESDRKVFGVTKFSDRSYDEYKVLLGRTNKKDYKEILSKPIQRRNLREEKKVQLQTTPTSVNWFDQGIVTPIKNQGQCGSCWAHSATEQMESQWAFNGLTSMTYGGALTEFAVQQINSCTPGCNGCGGGDLPQAFSYIQSLSDNTAKGPGIIPQAYAPYVQSSWISCSSMRCTKSCTDLNVQGAYTNWQLAGVYATISGYDYAIPECTATSSCNSQDLTGLAAYLAANGTAAICVNAANWNSYTGGIMSSTQCGGNGYNDLDHCVQLVGYNNVDPTNSYWIVRNSWSTDWGESGYIYLDMTTNTCGLANEAMYVTMQNGQANF